MSAPDPACVVESPLGRLRLTARAGALAAIDWTDDATRTPDDPLLRRAADQLADYFAGTRRGFDLPLAPAGSDHQRAVWRAMEAIPFGATRTYGDLAREVGSSARAVGAACGANPIPIVVPCHRVVAAGGRPGGYSGRGGLATKAALLALEGAAGACDARQGALAL